MSMMAGAGAGAAATKASPLPAFGIDASGDGKALVFGDGPDAIPLQQALDEGDADAWAMYRYQAKVSGLDPATQHQQIMADLGQTLRTIRVLPRGVGGIASNWSSFQSAAERTVTSRLNMLSARAARPIIPVPSIPVPAAAAHAPGAALAAEALPATQAIARITPKNPAAVVGGAIGAGASYLAGDAVRKGVAVPGGPTVSEMGTRPAGMANPDLRTTTRGAAVAMAGAPDPCKTGDGQNHHIVPSSLMTDNQDLLEAIGFRLDQPANMIRLPQTEAQRTDMEQLCGELRPLHSRAHGKGKGYSDAVDRQIDKVAQELGNKELSPVEANAKVGRLMDEIRGALTSGRYDSLADPKLAQFIRSLRL